MIDLSISIISWNTKDILNDCIKSVYDTTKGITFEIIVVDNASSDGTVDMIRENYPDVKLIANDYNMGFSKANNKAFIHSRGKYFLLLNPDTIVLNNCLKSLVDFLEEDVLVRGAVAPLVLNEDMSLQYSWAKLPTFWSEVKGVLDRDIEGISVSENVDEMSRLAPFLVGWVGGCCLMVSRRAIEHIGLMDESIFMYSEETDWCKRLWDAGWEVWLNPQVQIVHYGGKSSSQASDRSRKQLIKGKMIYFKNHKGWLQSAALGGILTLKWKLGKTTRKSRK